MMYKLQVDEEINLCLLHESMAPTLHARVRESYDHLSEWLQWPRVCKKEEAYREFIRSSLHKFAENKGMDCAIEYRGNMVGVCGFNAINSDLRIAEIGYWLSHHHVGLGIMTRSCRFLIDYAFTVLPVDKVQISAAENNKASRAVIERLGLNLEGVITNREKVGNKILNIAVYGIHRSKGKQSALH